MVQIATLLQDGFLKKNLNLDTFIPLARQLDLEVSANYDQGYFLVTRPHAVTTTFMIRISQSGKNIEFYQTYPTAKEDVEKFYQLLPPFGKALYSSHFLLDDVGYSYDEMDQCLQLALDKNQKELEILFEKGSTTPLFRSQGAKTAFLIPQELSVTGNALPPEEKYLFYMRLLSYSQKVSGCVPVVYLHNQQLIDVCSFPVTLEAQSKFSISQLNFTATRKEKVVLLIPSAPFEPKMVYIADFQKWLNAHEIKRKSNQDYQVAHISGEDFSQLPEARILD